MQKRLQKAPKHGGRKKSAIGFRVVKWLYMVVFVLSALIVGGYCVMTYAVHPPVVEAPQETQPAETEPSETDVVETAPVETDPTPQRRSEVYTCLIFGMDDGNGNTDTIMVATYDVPNQKIGLVSIPRDTVVSQDHSASMNKINAAYARGGVEEMDKELEELLGFPIDYYIKIKLSAFEKLVDNIGGVWFDVPINMDYDDPYQDLHIHLSKGYQLLNGEQAMGLVRYRQSNTDDSYGDVRRTANQQAFMKAMLSQVLSSASLDTLPGLVDILLNYVETDAGLNDMLYFARSLLGLDLDSAITSTTLPAEWHSPYMWVNQEEALEIINELLNPYTTEITGDMVEFFAR